MENSEKDTLPNLQTVLDAINGVEQRLTNVENDVREIKEIQFDFDIRLEQLQASVHQSLSLSYENRLNVRVMRKEIGAQPADMRNLAKQIA